MATHLCKLYVLLLVYVTVYGRSLQDNEDALSVDKAAFAERDQSVIVGSPGPNDKTLYRELINLPGKTLQITKRDISYPGGQPNPGLITCIRISDQMRNGKNAEVKIGSGGVGNKFAIINMKSKRGGPIKYVVEILGRP